MSEPKGGAGIPDRAVLLQSEQDTERLAQAVAGVLKGGEVLGLRGGLGAGKTTLVRYLVAALGGNPEEVSSPTYTLEHQYRVAGGRTVHHWDLYRIFSAPDELYETPRPHQIWVIEWPERCADLLAILDGTIDLSVVSGNGTVSGEVPAVPGEEQQGATRRHVVVRGVWSAAVYEALRAAGVAEGVQHE
jgi:tRNA threonylcarbamoyladenosine biosynthesis protein TsaE